MKTSRSPSCGRRRPQSGSLMAEMLVALGLLAMALLPLSVSFVREQATARALYHRAVAIAIVDGEIEALEAGHWRNFPPGSYDYRVQARAAENLPAGRFVLTREAARVRLEWLPAARGGGGRVFREFTLPGASAPTVGEEPREPAFPVGRGSAEPLGRSRILGSTESRPTGFLAPMDADSLGAKTFHEWTVRMISDAA